MCVFIYLKKYLYEGDYTVLSKIKITDDTTEESILSEFCTFMDNFQLEKEKKQQLKLKRDLEEAKQKVAQLEDKLKQEG